MKTNNAPSLCIRFRNAALEIIDDISNRVEEIPFIGRKLAQHRDRRNKDNLILFRIETESHFQETKLHVPNGFDKDDWKNLILSKLDNSSGMGDISKTHTNLYVWYITHLEKTLTPTEALKVMMDNDLPKKDTLTGLFGNPSP